MFKSLLPNNRTALEVQIEQTLADKHTKLDCNVISRLYDPWLCPVDLLPWLAWELSVDEWSEDWGDIVKRQLIADSYSLHKHKGTPYSIKTALQALGYNNVVIRDGQLNYYDGEQLHNDYVEYGGDLMWPLFDVLINDPHVCRHNSHYFYNQKQKYGSQNVGKITAQINQYKNERSVLRNLSLKENTGTLSFFIHFHDASFYYNGFQSYQFGSING